MANSHRHFYDFGPFRLSATEGILLQDGNAVGLTPKAIETLLVLVANRPRVLSKEELLQAVWPDTVVEENNLTQQISALRKALGGDQKGQQYIETIPKRGYRFIAPVSESWEDAPAIAAVTQAPVAPESQATPEIALTPDLPKAETSVRSPDNRRFLLLALITLSVLGLAGAGVAIYRNNSIAMHAAPEVRRSLAVFEFKNPFKQSGGSMAVHRPR